MTTAKAVLKRMVDLMPDDMGMHFAIASGSGTTVVVSELANSKYADDYFDDWTLIRPEAATTADRLRNITAFAKATGTFTVATMSDTTFTSETVILLHRSITARAMMDAIQHSLQRSRRLYTLEFPAHASVDHWLRDAQSWIEQPSDVIRAGWSTRPILTVNRYMENWPSYDSSGNLVPAGWLLSGSGASYGRSDLESDTSIASRTRYGLSITRAGTDCYTYQRVPLRITGDTDDGLYGETVTGMARVHADTASRVRVRVTDGVDTTNSDYHTGGSTFEELTAQHTVNAAATYLEVQVRVETGDVTAYVDEAALAFGTWDDSMRKDNYHWYPALPSWNQSGGLPARLLPRQKGSSYRISAFRSYPALDSTRLASGAADPDTIDAPEDLIAYGALAQLFKRAMRDNEANSFEAYKAAEYEQTYQSLHKQHGYSPRRTLPTYRPVLAPARRY